MPYAAFRVAPLAVALALLPSLRAGVDPSTFDPSVRPQDDFYRYVNGRWLSTATIPPDRSWWGAAPALREHTLLDLKTVCERASATADQGAPAERQVGDFYASGLDDAAIASAGSDPLRFEFERIDALNTRADIWSEIAHLHSLGVWVGFRFSSDIDAKNSGQMIAELSQDGLGLPERDYYFDPSKQALREQYVTHVIHMLELLGTGHVDAVSQSAAILKLETTLAQASTKQVDLRDPYRTYHKMTRAQLATLAPNLDWDGYFSSFRGVTFHELNVAEPDFFTAFASTFAATSVADWKAYLRWHFLHRFALGLAPDFVNEDFRFYGRALTGAKALPPRWKLVVQTIDRSIGEDLGQLYVASFFPPESRTRALDLVAHVRAALRHRLEGVEWMDDATRERALAKIDALHVQVGYPDHWRDYSTLVIDRGPYVLNILKSSAFEVRRDLRKIGHPPDRGEWFMTPQTVNAYYSPTRNEIVITAAILQPPFFDPNADDPVNYGGIGVTIGHEMTHGFDDHGRQYDAQGNLADWWSPESAARFKARAAVIVKQFDAYTVSPTLHVNGRLTEGENIADLGGLKMAFAALQSSLAANPLQPVGGLTPQQRFFASFAASWRTKYTPEQLDLFTRTDPHSPAQYRVNGPLSNFEEFARAFDVPPGAPMRRPDAERVSIW